MYKCDSTWYCIPLKALPFEAIIVHYVEKYREVYVRSFQFICLKSSTGR